MKKRIVALVLACVLMFALAACGGSTSAPAATDEVGTQNNTEAPAPAGNVDADGKKVITVAMTLNMGDMDAFAASSQSRNAMRYSTYEYLAVFTEFGQSYEEMEKQLAKTITKVDDFTYDVEIYDYIVDAAGEKITAEDVAWSMNTLDESAMYNRVSNGLEKAEATGDYTVRIYLASDVIGGIEYLLAQCNIVSKASYEANGDKNSTTPITTAAYQITSCTSGSEYIMTKNENYWQKEELRGTYNQQPVDEFDIKIITEAAQVATALIEGTVDLVTSVSTANLGYFVKDDMTPVDGYSINIYDDTTGIMLGYNMSEGNIFADNLALRQAIAYGVDSAAIVTGALKGYGTVMKDVSVHMCFDFNEDWLNEDYYSYDPDKAAALLEEAGYKGGVDPATKKPLHIVFMYESSRETAATIVQATLMQLGLDIEMKPVDDSMISSSQTDPTAWDLMMSKCGADYTMTGPYNTELAADKEGKARRAFFVDEEFQSLLDTAQSVSGNTPESVEALHDYVADNCMKIGLYYQKSVTAGKAGIEIFNHPWGPLVWTACDYTGYFA